MRILYFTAFFVSTITNAQVGAGTQNPEASLHISVTGKPNLLVINNQQNNLLAVTKNAIAINKQHADNIIDIDVKSNTNLNIKADLNSNYTSDALRLSLKDNGDLVTSNYKIGDIIFKKSYNTLLINNNITRHQNLQVYLTPGVYKMDALVRYSSMSSRDVKVGVVAPIDAVGNFSAHALYASFTTTTVASEALPFKNANIHEQFVVLGGEDNTSSKILNANIKGYITIASAGYVTLRFLQQANATFDSTIYPESYLQFERIK